MAQQLKRSWIYGGLAHPEKVALVRPARPKTRRLPADACLLVVGDEHARGVALPLRHLCRDRKVDCREALDDEGLEAWALDRRLRKPVAEHRPTIVVVSLPTGAITEPELEPLLRVVAEDARSQKGTCVWLRPPTSDERTDMLKRALFRARIPGFHADVLPVPRGPDGVTPSATGYAGLAGALLRWIG